MFILYKKERNHLTSFGAQSVWNDAARRGDHLLSKTMNLYNARVQYIIMQTSTFYINI